jgi:hypothetical protein
VFVQSASIDTEEGYKFGFQSLCIPERIKRLEIPQIWEEEEEEEEEEEVVSRCVIPPAYPRTRAPSSDGGRTEHQ